MHESVHAFVGKVVEDHVLDKPDAKIVELGSHDVNGTNKDHFVYADYVGVDFRAGPNVDIVAYSWSTGLPDRSVDVVVCTEMLEHDEWPQQTFDEVRRILKRGGWFITTTRAPGYPYHEHPGDYFRYTLGDLQGWFAYMGVMPEYLESDPQAPGVMGAGKLVLPSSRLAPALRGVEAPFT